jgi:uncharacterized protein YraI
MKVIALAAGATLATLGAAHAATVTSDLNLRAGPGTDYPVIEAMPAGAHVNIRNCTGSWCRLSYNGETGWASSSYLAGGGRSTTVYRTRTYTEPSVEYVEPGYAYAPVYDYGPYAYEPGFSIGIGFGGGGWHHGWHHGGWHHHWH